MRCIFCREESHSSKTVEHIIPESLGNTEHLLPLGVVCDKCNNYFGREIEKPLLETDYFLQARLRNTIFSKKGKLPPTIGVHLQSLVPIEVVVSKKGMSIYPLQEEEQFISSVLSSQKGSLIIPKPKPLNECTQPDRYIFSRFLGKVALEVLAQRFLLVPRGLDEIVEKKELDNLRNYVRCGSVKLLWPYHQRTIYSEDHVFFSQDKGSYEVLHEYTLLYTEAQELYLVLILFGIEYALNMGEPEINTYIEWIEKNGGKSPLYMY